MERSILSNVGNKFKVGVLVILSSVLLVFGLTMLGVLKYFSETYEFMTVIETSVQGLRKGSLVKYKGVPIGQVNKIQISNVDENVYVFMYFDPEAFSYDAVKEIQMRGGFSYFENELEKYVEQGMRCQLKYAGITGDLYVEVAIFDPAIYPPKEYVLPADHPPYMPSVPQLSFGDLMEAANKSLLNLTHIDFAKISGKLDTFLDSANSLIADKSVRHTLEQMKDATANLAEITDSLKKSITAQKTDNLISSIFDATNKLNSALDQVSAFVAELETTVKRSEIPETTDSMRDMMAEAKETMKRIDQLSESLKSLSDYLEENPNSIINGRKDVPVVKP